MNENQSVDKDQHWFSILAPPFYNNLYIFPIKLHPKRKITDCFHITNLRCHIKGLFCDTYPAVLDGGVFHSDIINQKEPKLLF